MTSAAPTAPENGAITQGEMEAEMEGEMGDEAAVFGRSASNASSVWGRDPDSESGGGSGTGSALNCDLGSGDTCGPALVSLETSAGSRSIVGGARLTRPESGSDPASSSLSSTIATVPQGDHAPNLDTLKAGLIP